MESIIKAVNISKSFGDLNVLKEINLEVSKAEIVAIIGASGAGKTTLLQILGTLDKPTNGKVIIDGVDITSLNDKKLSQFRNKNIGFVFQFHNLLPEFTALENVMIPALISNDSQENVKSKASILLEKFGLKDRFNHKPNELSGGEQQRVAVARALINNPKVILADEPSGNLDSERSADLHVLLKKLRDDFNQTIIVVTHSKELAELADRQILIKDGILM